MMSFEDFKHFYNDRGYLPNDIIKKRNNQLNERQLQTRYQKYVNSEDKKAKAKERYIEKAKEKPIKIDERWEKLSKEIKERDEYKCRLYLILNYSDLADLREKAKGFLNILDGAHIFPKSTYPEFKYDSDNIVCLNRYSHSLLDQYKHPILGTAITKEEHEVWWRLIAGKQYIVMKNKIKELKIKKTI